MMRKAGQQAVGSNAVAVAVSGDGPVPFTLVPQAMFFTKGVGKHRHSLESFEAALRHAGIAHCNLVRVSSIFPPGCKIISRRAGVKRLAPGAITFCVMAESRTNEPNRLISAGIGLAQPASGDRYGLSSFIGR